MNATTSPSQEIEVGLLTIGSNSVESVNQLEIERLVFSHEQKAFEAVGAIIDITAEIFGSPIEIRRSADPESPDEICTCFQVSARGSAEELIAMENHWVRRVAKIQPKWDNFCLSIRSAT